MLMSVVCLSAQQKAGATDAGNTLHSQRPDYQMPYKEWKAEEIKSLLDRIFTFIDKSTPAKVIDKKTGKEIGNYAEIDENSALQTGAFRLTSYEWGVTYYAMLEMADASGDRRYFDYAASRLRFLAETAPYFKRNSLDYPQMDAQIRQVLYPLALDDSGAMCAAMCKIQQSDSSINLNSLIDNYIDYIMNREYRLSDGTFARKRPQFNTLWLDDMYMGIPALVQMGKFTGDNKYFDEAVRQIRQFSERMFVKDKGLFMHGWVEGEEFHPAFHWARANGWALLTLTETLDVLPSEHPGYEYVMQLYKAHVRGLAALQSGEGFWHQLLDRPDSYLETSATAIFTYCIARGVNRGWLDAVSFAPVAQLAWSAVSTKINAEGQVEGVCVGTGMAFDPAFYYYRPVNVYAAHGYGTALLAGAEMMRLLGKFYPRLNDSAIQYYSVPQASKSGIFGITTVNRTAP
ncbi:MAG: glycoside hydrolase family 88 protein [Dysgonamonadaceae bacterium]|nr:glycoside hydrolase family 88 protein [Dysgonamonadaceae bacterium]